MALPKDKIVKGVNCPYWKIVDCDVKRGFVAIAPYVSRETAAARENMMDGRTVFRIDFPVDVASPISYAYGKVKESRKETRIVTEGIPAVVNVDGIVIQEGVPPVTEEVETNWFADAEDV